MYPSDFAKFLTDRWAVASARNPRYSLRSFARSLSIDPSTLSQIMRGRRPATRKTVEKLCGKLGLPPEAAQVYLDDRGGRRRSPGEIGRLPLDQYYVLSDWYHFALLKLTHLQSFKGDSRWIANALGISSDLVNIVVQRLCRLNLLKLGKNDAWQDLSHGAASGFESSSEEQDARIQAGNLRLALEALDRVPAAFRTEGSLTFAADSHQIGLIKTRIEAFLGEMAAFAQSSAAKDDVFQIQVACFPLTNLHVGKGHHGKPGDALADFVEES